MSKYRNSCTKSQLNSLKEAFQSKGTADLEASQTVKRGMTTAVQEGSPTTLENVLKLLEKLVWRPA
jgi:hypothetical protein